MKKFVINTLSFEEKATLAGAYNILKEIEENFDGENFVESVETGEVVCFDEIPRVLGILSAFVDNDLWRLT